MNIIKLLYYTIINIFHIFIRYILRNDKIYVLVILIIYPYMILSCNSKFNQINLLQIHTFIYNISKI